jgi:hypothetical protein
LSQKWCTEEETFEIQTPIDVPRCRRCSTAAGLPVFRTPKFCGFTNVTMKKEMSGFISNFREMGEVSERRKE